MTALLPGNVSGDYTAVKLTSYPRCHGGPPESPHQRIISHYWGHNYHMGIHPTGKGQRHADSSARASVQTALGSRVPHPAEIAPELCGLNAGVGCFGAELYLLAEELRRFQSLSQKEYLPWLGSLDAQMIVTPDEAIHLLDIRFQMERFRQSLAGLQEFVSPLEEGNEVTSKASHVVQEIALLTGDLGKRKLTIESFIEQCWQLHQQMCQATVFCDLPESHLSQQLSLLEFNTNYSGISSKVIDKIREIGAHLLIDPDQAGYQEGFARNMNKHEVMQLLCSSGARVFMLQSGQDTVGYFMFLPNPSAVLLPDAKLFELLVEKGLIAEASRSRVGFVRSAAVRREGRMDFARAGINAGDLLAQATSQTAYWIGCDAIVCTVRAGKNPNVAIKSHGRRGLQPAGIRIGESEVLFLPFNSETRTPRDGTADSPFPTSPFPLEITDTPESGETPTSLVSSFWALGFIAAAAETFWHDDASVSHEFTRDNRLVITIQFSKYRHITITQSVPSLDLWRIERDAPEEVMNLEQIRACLQARAESERSFR